MVRESIYSKETGWGCLFLVLSAIAAAFGGMAGERAMANTTDVTMK